MHFLPIRLTQQMCCTHERGAAVIKNVNNVRNLRIQLPGHLKIMIIPWNEPFEFIWVSRQGCDEIIFSPPMKLELRTESTQYLQTALLSFQAVAH